MNATTDHDKGQGFRELDMTRDVCFVPIAGTQNRCTRDNGHDGEHRCKAYDVDTRAARRR